MSSSGYSKKSWYFLDEYVFGGKKRKKAKKLASHAKRRKRKKEIKDIILFNEFIK